MKKTLLIPLAASLLVGCATSTEGSSSLSSNEDLSSSETTSSSEEASSSSEESSSSASSDTRLADIKTFLSALYPLNGHPNKATVLTETTYNIGYEISGTDNFTVERFSRAGESDIQVRKGTQTVGDSSSSYEMQTFVQNGNIYALTKIDDVPQSRKSAIYESTMLEHDIGFSLYYIQESNLNYLANFLDSSDDICEVNLPKDIPENGTSSFFYSLAYKEGTTDVKISHDWSMTTSNGIITGYVHDYAFERSVMSEASNSTTSRETVSFEQGEYPTFTGDVWNPSDFPIAEE